MLNERGVFILVVLVLCGVGVLMVYSASVTSRPTDQQEVYLTRHLAALVIGGVVAVGDGAVYTTRADEDDLRYLQRVVLPR